MERPKVIDNQKLFTRGRSAAEKGLIGVGTGVLLYFFTLITLVAWYFAGAYFLDTVFSWRYVEDTIHILLWLLVVALASTLIFLVWGEYNFRTYANRNRRQFPDPVKTSDIAQIFHITETAVLAAQSSKFMEFNVLFGKHIMCDNENGCIIVKEFVGESKGTAKF